MPSSDRTHPETADTAVHVHQGCACGVGRSAAGRTLGLPAGVEAGPVLDDPPGVRHLAKLGVDGRWYTLCGQKVPKDHRCPTEQELRAIEVWTLRSCAGCHQVYLVG